MIGGKQNGRTVSHKFALNEMKLHFCPIGRSMHSLHTDRRPRYPKPSDDEELVTFEVRMIKTTYKPING